MKSSEMLGIIIILAGAQGSVLPYEACSAVACRAGRECVVLENKNTDCVCITKCPDHWKPVCGSDGKSYDNHCELHRTACIDGVHISPLHPGFCKGERDALIAREEFIEQISHWGEEKDVPAPLACFENDRNRLREFLISWFDLSSRKQPWFSHGMTHNEILSGHFTGMDVDEDGYLDSQELYKYISRNSSQPQIKTDKIRELCLDALVEEGDVNMDWRLSYSEYKEILQDGYIPSSQVCKLNGRIYNDGAETSVECNGCVCACGKWICTSNLCTEGYKDIFNNDNLDDDDDDDEDEGEDRYKDIQDSRTKHPLDLKTKGGLNTKETTYKMLLNNRIYSHDDMDDDDANYEYDEDGDDDDDDEPEEDPDVQDINWF